MDDVRSAPERWLELHGDAMFRYALVRLHDRARAEDAVQDALLAALAARTNFRGEAAERSWLFGILKHKIVDQFRRDARERPFTNDGDTESVADTLFGPAGAWRDLPQEWTDPAAGLEREEFWIVFKQCLNNLPIGLADTVRLVEIDELDGGTACKALGISPTNLWVRLHRARLRLRECIEHLWFSGRRGERSRRDDDLR